MTRGRKPSKRKGYFYEKEEEAVVQYLKSDSAEEKNEIYNTVIKPAFHKMVESIIRRYNLYVPDEDFEETFTDTLSFLLTKMDKFNPDRNYKAYSYCGTICKNYLLYRINKYAKNQKKILPYDSVDKDIRDNIKYSDAADNAHKFVEELMDETIKKIHSILEDNSITLKINERKVGEALLRLLENWEQVISTDGSRKLNKSAVLLFLRDETNLSTKEVRDNMKKFYNGYYSVKKKLVE